MKEPNKTNKATTYSLQTELSNRMGVKTVSVGLFDEIEIRVNGQIADQRKGPVTVSVNWD